MAKKKNFPLRIDPKVYEALERWASDEFRSVNGHLEYVLREALREAGRLPGVARLPDNAGADTSIETDIDAE